MRSFVFLLSSLIVFIAFNVSIWEKEKIKAEGETVFLELAPVDPRSLMQGDYMRLRYAIENSQTFSGKQERGYLVISLDSNRVAKFVRYHNNEPLSEGEKLLHFHNYLGHIRIVPSSFMFQEGHAPHYERAKYGIFKFDASGNHLLVGLADDKFRAISPDAGA